MDVSFENSSKLTDKTEIYFGWAEQNFLLEKFITSIRRLLNIRTVQTLPTIAPGKCLQLSWLIQYPIPHLKIIIKANLLSHFPTFLSVTVTLNVFDCCLKSKYTLNQILQAQYFRKYLRGERLSRKKNADLWNSLKLASQLSSSGGEEPRSTVNPSGNPFL